MTHIDPASQLAALIRVQVASLRKPASRGRAASGAPSRMAPSAPQGLGAPADLASVVAQRIRAIAPDDPQRERKAFRMFLETVLLAELGASIVNDPSFAVMVDHVQNQMEADPELAQASRAAARVLLESAPPS